MPMTGDVEKLEEGKVDVARDPLPLRTLVSPLVITMWALAIFAGVAVLVFVDPSWNLFDVASYVIVVGLGVLLLLGISDMNRHRWALRVVTGAIFVFLAFRFGVDALRVLGVLPRELWSGDTAIASFVRLLMVGVPAGLFAIYGRFPSEYMGRSSEKAKGGSGHGVAGE